MSTTELVLTIITVIVGYLLGSISPSILIAKAKGVDIKSEGSGNAGTTNMLRVMGKKPAAITLVLDILKGVAAVLLARYVAGDFAAMLTVFSVFAGHVWPLYHKFKGGKGVATLFGAILAFHWLVALIALGIVAIGVAVSRRMSVGSLLGAVTLPIQSAFIAPDFVIPSILIALLLIYKHWGNIVRLSKGQEPKLGEKKE